jgi:type I restriction enzyme S subunit
MNVKTSLEESKDISKPEQLITEHIDIWTSAILARSTSGRGSSKKYELYGIRKLRELILELAVRGKLVPQNVNDEPASVLLEKIATEKDRLIEEKEVKKSRTLPKFIKEDELFELPLGWEWCRLLDIGHDWGQKIPNTDFTYIDVGSIDKKLGLIKNADVLNADNAPSRARKIVKRGTVIYSTVRPYLLNIAIVNRQFEPEPIASTAFAIIHPLSGISNSFVYRYLRSPSFVSYVESCQTGIAYPAINDKQFFSGLIPIPPTNEQHRIVAKVDELMLLCDQLEQQTEASIDAHAMLVEVLLATLIDSADADELEQNWARISEHFDSLFTTEKSIEALKQTVLQLAVMGKLVPQNPDDEPASVLLEKIAEEKALLIKEKKIKKQKPLPAITDDDKPFELPQGWTWCRLPEVGELARGKSKHRPRNDPTLFAKGNIPLVQTGDVARAENIIETHTSLYNEYGLAQSRLWPRNTLCITIAANIADTALLGFDACFPDSVVGFLTFDKAMDISYFDYYLRTAKNHLEDFAPSTAQKNINLEILGSLLVPLPPLNELNSIAKRVEGLLSLCDQLKEKLQQSQETQVQLTDALVDRALG